MRPVSAGAAAPALVSCPRGQLAELGARFGLEGHQLEQLARLLTVLADDDRAPTTVRRAGEAVERHLADSLVALELEAVRRARRLLDLGAGAGFPGLALAIALPAAEVQLVESQARKCAFLERAVDSIGAGNARVICERVETWPERDLDVVCVRAVAPLAVLVEWAAPLLRRHGVLIAWKGRRDAAEERAAALTAAQVGLELCEIRDVQPFPAARDRRLHVYAKVAATPDRFPRRPGMARKRPLIK